MILNLYASNNRALKYREQKLAKQRNFNKYIITVNTFLSIIIDQVNKNISKHRMYLNSSINKPKVIYGIWHPATGENTFFVSTYGTFISIDQELICKISLKGLVSDYELWPHCKLGIIHNQKEGLKNQCVEKILNNSKHVGILRLLQKKS